MDDIYRCTGLASLREDGSFSYCDAIYKRTDDDTCGDRV